MTLVAQEAEPVTATVSSWWGRVGTLGLNPEFGLPTFLQRTGVSCQTCLLHTGRQ